MQNLMTTLFHLVSQLPPEAVSVLPADPQASAEAAEKVAPHAALAALTIGAVIRALTGALKTDALKGVWCKFPWFAKISVLLGLTAICFFVDSLALGQNWMIAAGSALTGLFGAVTSHEWQSLIKEAQQEREEEQAASKKSFDVVPGAHTEIAEVAAPTDTSKGA